MVAEEVDGLAGLMHGLAPDVPIAPLERQVLPDQQPGPVGRVVYLRAGDMGVDADQVESGVGRQFDVPDQFGWWGRRQVAPGGTEVGSFEEEALTVDRGDEVAHLDLAQTGDDRSLVAGPVSVPGPDVDPVEGLGAEGPGPPQVGAFHGHPPAHRVGPGREVLVLDVGRFERVVAVAGDDRLELDGAGGRAVQHCLQLQHGPFFARLPAQHLQGLDADRAGPVDAHV